MIKKISIKKIILLSLSGFFFLLSSPSLTSMAKEIYVSPTGLFECSTISQAVEKAVDGDTIVVFPGTYEESVITEKGLNLIGISKEECIITNDYEDYEKPVLMLPYGSVENLTLYARQKEEGSVYNIEELEKNHSVVSSTNYALHVESDKSVNHSLFVINCDIISECNHCVGIGLRKDFKITFDKCKLNATHYSYPILMHDSAYQHKGDSYITFRDTSLLAPGRFAMALMTYDSTSSHSFLVFENLDISETAGVYNIFNKDREKGEGFCGSEGFFLASDAESDPSILNKITNMPCSIWSAPSTLPENKVKALPEGYELRVYPYPVKSLLGDGKKFYMTFKGSYVLCRCLDDLLSESESETESEQNNNMAVYERTAEP